MKFKRVVACGDMHCGHRTGLTPPKYQSKRCGQSYLQIQRDCWDFYQQTIEDLKPISVVISNGDHIDGKGYRSGGTELIQSDRKEQVAMSVEALSLSEADHIVCTYGTPFHTGNEDDWEGLITSRLCDRGFNATIKSQEWITVNGTTFDIKHKVGASTIPHGRSTPIKKEQLWNLIWAEIGDQPKAKIILRSHVHYLDYSGTPEYLAMSLPALQGQGTKFGARQCSGVVDFGLVWFDCYEDGNFTWSYKVLRAESQKCLAREL